MMANKYIEEFSDPSEKWWKTSNADDTVIFRTPNGGDIPLNNGDVDFHLQFNTQSDSSRMWLLSLGFSPLIDNAEVINLLLQNFARELDAGAFTETFASGLSMDHCAAIRARAMCVLYSRYDDANIKSLARRIAIEACEWAFRPDYLERNNHGMMFAVALLHASFIMEIEEKERYEALAFEFLTSLFTEVFADNSTAMKTLSATTTSM